MSYKSVMPSLAKATEDHSHLVAWRLRSIAALRVIFGCVWAFDAWFEWQLAITNNITNHLTPTVADQSTAIQLWLMFWVHVAKLNPHLFTYLMATGETALALCLIVGAFNNMACGVGILLSLLIWSTAGSFGGPYGQGSADIGVALLHVLVFAGLFLGKAGLTFGVDRYLSKGWRGQTMLATDRFYRSESPWRDTGSYDTRAVSDQQRIGSRSRPLTKRRAPQVSVTPARVDALNKQRLSPM